MLCFDLFAVCACLANPDMPGTARHCLVPVWHYPALSFTAWFLYALPGSSWLDSVRCSVTLAYSCPVTTSQCLALSGTFLALPGDSALHGLCLALLNTACHSLDSCLALTVFFCYLCWTARVWLCKWHACYFMPPARHLLDKACHLPSTVCALPCIRPLQRKSHLCIPRKGSVRLQF